MRRSSLTPVARLALGLAVLVIGSSAWATWKWRDAAGKIQYTDLPPPASVQDKDILMRPASDLPHHVVARASEADAGASAAAQPAAAKASDPQLEKRLHEKEQKDKAAKQAEADQAAAARAENCTRARSYQKSLDDGLRIARVNDKGEREVLDDAARAKEAARTQEVITRDCAASPAH